MEYILNILRGILIGIANIIPGISGGTIALILGIYERLMDAIGNLFNFKNKLRDSWLSRFLLLFTVGIGALFAVVALTRIMLIIIESQLRQLVYFLFGGLIAGSIPFIMRLHKDMKPTAGRVVSTFLGFALILTVILVSLYRNPNHITKSNSLEVSKEKMESIHVFSNSVDTSKFIITDPEVQLTEKQAQQFNIGYCLWLSAVGFLSGGAMILPGISGSSLLVALGEYEAVLRIIDQRLWLLFSFLAVGSLLGILLLAKLISVLFKKYPAGTMYFVLGLILGSFYQIWLQINQTFSFKPLILSLSIVGFTAGFFATYFLSRIDLKRKHQKDTA